MKLYKNILIVKMSSLGDVLHALPTLYALREYLKTTLEKRNAKYPE